MLESRIESTDEFPEHVIPLADRDATHQFVWCAGVFCIVVAIWTGLRLYSRRVRQMSMGLEDMLYHISVAAFYGFIVALFMALYLGGAGYHMDKLNKWHVARITQSFLVVQALYGLSMCTAKWSMLFMLKRIFAVRYFKIITWVIIGLQAGWLVMTVLIGFLICRPVQKNWDPTSPGVCGNRIAGYTAVSVVNVIVDILMLILPLPMVFNLQVKSGYKIGLYSIFGVGIVTIIFSVIRLQSLNEINFDDFSYTVVPVMTWTTAENGIIILVASSALLRPVFDKMFGRLLSLTSTRNRLGDTGEMYPYGQGSRSGLGLGSRKRKEFISVDGDSSHGQPGDFVELGDVGPRTHITVGTRRSQGDMLDSFATREDERTAEARKTIINVKSTVVQTYSEPRGLGTEMR